MNRGSGIFERGILALSGFGLKRSKTALALYAVALALAVAGAARLGFDASVDVFFDPETHSWIRGKEVTSQFAAEEQVVVALHAADIFTPDNLALIARLTERFEELDHVDEVISLTTVNDIKGEDNAFFVEKLLGDGPWSDAAALREIRERALGNPLFVKNVISTDGRTAGILVDVEDVPGSDASERQALVKSLLAILAEEVPTDVSAHLSGNGGIEYYYSLYMQGDLERFLPLALALMIAVLLVAFRKARLVAFPMIVIGLALVFSLAFMRAVGLKINNATVIVPPIILAIALAGAVHYVAKAMRPGAGSRQAHLLGVARRLYAPCLLASLTTAVGFFSLTVSRTPAIRQLGLVAGAGTLLAFLTTFALLPLLMKFGPTAAGAEVGRDALDRLLAGIGTFNARFRARILVVAAVLAGLSVWGATRIVAETSLLDQLNPRMRIYQDTLFIERHLSGVEVAYFSFAHAETDAFKDPARLRALAELEDRLRAFPQVDKVMSVNDFLRDMNRAFHNGNPEFYRIPDTREAVAQYALLYGAEDIERYMDPAWSWTILEVRLTERSSARLLKLFAEFRAFTEREEFADMTVDLVGPSVTGSEGAVTVVDGQIRSLAMALIVIFGMMFVVFRSGSVGLICMVPNVFPLLINFGIMGFFGVPLDTATAMISAIGIGIIVDDTIHYTYAYGECLRQCGGDHDRAMRASILSAGRAISFTSVILFVSFGSLMASQFIPTFQFGLLSSLVMVNALAADLFVLPCLFTWLKPTFRQRGD